MNELLTYMLAAPASEIEAMSPKTIKECAGLLGISWEEYDNSKHYPIIIARMRRHWAQAMLQEAMGEGGRYDRTRT